MKIINDRKNVTNKILNTKSVTKKVKNKIKKKKITKNIKKKNVKCNKYLTSKVVSKFKLIDMPYINMDYLESKYILRPLKNIKTNKESTNNELYLKDEFQSLNDIEKNTSWILEKIFIRISILHG